MRYTVLADWGYTVPVSSPDTVHTPETAHTPEAVHSNDPSIPSAESNPPISPIELLVSDSPTGLWAEVLALCNLVPIRQIRKNHEVMTVPALQLMDEHNIMLLMATDDPKADVHHTIDYVHYTIQYIFYSFAKYT